jgi:hypothetical protein
MKILEKEHAIKLVNWYDKVGVKNWGTWGNYPTICTGTSYASFETCHCRIRFDELIEIDKICYQGVSDCRNQLVPGKGNYISFEELREIFIDGYKEQRKNEVEEAENKCFENFDFSLFNELKINYPTTGNKKERHNFERRTLLSCGFLKNDNISMGWGYYLASQKSII